MSERNSKKTNSKNWLPPTLITFLAASACTLTYFLGRADSLEEVEELNTSLKKAEERIHNLEKSLGYIIEKQERTRTVTTKEELKALFDRFNGKNNRKKTASPDPAPQSGQSNSEKLFHSSLNI